MRKSLLAFIAVVAAIAGYAQSFDYEGVTYTVLSESDKTCELTKGDYSSVDVTIPSSVLYNGEDYAVVSIGDWAFSYCGSLIEINIPEGVVTIGYSAFRECELLTAIILPAGLTTIGDYAFYKCSSLTSITIPEGVISIGSCAFEYCYSLTSIDIPKGVIAIGNYAFCSCYSLTTIDLPESLTTIGDAAFQYCYSLTEITIPESVATIGIYVFDSCSSLTTIEVSENNRYYSSIDGVLFTNDIDSLIRCPEGKGGAYEVPDRVTSIEDSAFYKCSLLTSINIPESVTSIGYSAFLECSSLTSINVSDNNLYYTSIDGVLFTKDIETLIRCPEGKGGVYAVPEGVTSIGYRAFIACSLLTSITLPKSLTTIGDWAFKECYSLTSIDIPEGVASIEDGAFEECYSLTSIIIPDGVTTIGFSAFLKCSSLTSITIPAGLVTIGSWAFAYCDSLSLFNSYSNNPPVCDYLTFYGLPTDAILHVPEGTRDDYASVDGWFVFMSIVDDLVVENGIREIEAEQVDNEGETEIYNLQGRRMSVSGIDGLPAGIYIVGGRKVLVK